MRLLLINPICNDVFNNMVRAAMDRERPVGAELTVMGLSEGPAAIEGFADELLSAPHVLSLIKREEANYDGFFVNCFGDVAVDAAREITDKPVLGAGEAAFYLAGAVGVPFSIVTIGSNPRNKMAYRFRELGCSRFVSGVGIPEGVLALNSDPEATAQHIVSAFIKERDERGAELLVLGCTGMVDVSKIVREKLACPVIEPSVAGVKLLELFVGIGVSHCRGGKYTPCEL